MNQRLSMTEVKRLLVAAHRAGDWQEAKRLSQLRQKAKRRPRCSVCGIRICSGAMRCGYHQRLAIHGRKLRMLRVRRIAPVLSVVLTACVSTPVPTPHTALVARPTEPQAIHVYRLDGRIVPPATGVFTSTGATAVSAPAKPIVEEQ